MRVNLRATIEVKSGSQTAFAQKSGIELSRLNRIIRGWIEPTRVECERCAEVLGVDANWLFRIFTLPSATAPDELAEVATELRSIADRFA